MLSIYSQPYDVLVQLEISRSLAIANTLLGNQLQKLRVKRISRSIMLLTSIGLLHVSI